MTRQLRTGWRAWLYRGKRRASTRRRAHQVTGAALWMSVKLTR